MNPNVDGYQANSKNDEKSLPPAPKKREESQIWSKFKNDKLSNQVEGMKVMKAIPILDNGNGFQNLKTSSVTLVTRQWLP